MENDNGLSTQDEPNSCDNKVELVNIDNKTITEEEDVKTAVTESDNQTDMEVKDKQEETGITSADLIDQNISSSWVFVDVKPADGAKQDNTNKFYLDCSEEPVQELHEHELSVPNSGSEDDTDGISVISDLDASKTDEEEGSHTDVVGDTVNTNTVTDTAIKTKESSSSREIVQGSDNPPTVHKPAFTVNQISYIAAFSVVILLVPLQWYFKNNDFDRKEIETQQEILNILSQKKIRTQEQENPSSQHVIIDDALTYCTRIHENSDYMYKNRNIKKCMKKLERAKDKLNRVHKNLQNTIPETDDNTGQEDVEEIHLNYNSVYSKVNNDENKHEVYSKKVRYRKPNENKGKNKYHKEYKITRNTTNKDSEAYKFEYHSDNESRKNHTQRNSKSHAKDRYKQPKKDEGYEHKLRAQEMYLREKENFLLRKEQKLKQRELRSHTKQTPAPNIDEKIQKTQNESSKNTKDKAYKKHHKEEHIHKVENSKEQYRKKNYNQFEHSREQQNEKKYRQYETKSSSTDDSSTEHKDNRLYHGNKNEKEKYKRHMKQKDERSPVLPENHATDGDWYNELFEGRSKFRKNNVYESSHEDGHNERSKDRKKSFKSKYETEEEKDKNGQWYSKLFEGRAKLRKSSDKYFMKDEDFMNEYKLYSNRYRSDSISL